METTIIILSATRYEITDEFTGEVTKGITVWFYPSAKFGQFDNGKGQLGRKPCKSSLPFDEFDKLSKACVPGAFSCEVEMTASGDKNKASLNIVKVIDFVRPLLHEDGIGNKKN